ncbi:MFS transporter [Rhodococcus spongiicola]|uniref:MFS transporter n=1 Tax=Rhodococcus spongiicola TaxID=2487352 RepID=A0A3S3ACW1_9NOCA|nr:MFS transporter [Rhodococcus spongiicola]RVW01561.1 MFS transporter [Rhodococcus spongiicola]
MSAGTPTGPGDVERGSAENAPNPPPAEGSVLAPPTEMPRIPYLVAFGFAQFALFVALLGPVLVSMGIKLISLVGEDDAPQATGLVLGVGAIAAMIANPVFGRISDRTTGPWGRRRPWIIGGSVGLAVALLAIALANSVVVLVIGWFIAQVLANAAFAAYLATIPDQIPPHRHASISGYVNITQNLGILASTYIASFFESNMLALFMVPAVIGLVGMSIFAIVLPDKPLTVKPPRMRARGWITMFWVSPRKHPDFIWVILSRLLLFVGMYLFVTFRLFWVQDQVGLDLSAATSAVATAVLIYTIALLVTTQIAGYVADRLNRRKAPVFISTMIYAIGTLLLIGVDTVGGFYIIEAALGIAYGIYFASNFALVLAVLPDPDNPAKDLGMFNMANALPQSLAPLIGAVLLEVGSGGQNYTLLLGVAGVAVFVGAMAVLPIKAR